MPARVEGVMFAGEHIVKLIGNAIRADNYAVYVPMRMSIILFFTFKSVIFV